MVFRFRFSCLACLPTVFLAFGFRLSASEWVRSLLQSHRSSAFGLRFRFSCIESNPARDSPDHVSHKLWDPKRKSPNKTMWLIAFAGELEDVVSRPLPHGILRTSEKKPSRGSPQKVRTGVCLNFSLFVQGGPGASGFFGSLLA